MREPEDNAAAKGFTLAELLIVVVVIILLAAVVVPNLLRSQLAANEAGAIASLTMVNQAESSYQSAYPTVGFAATLASLGPLGTEDNCKNPTAEHACLVENALAQATSPERDRSGYLFSLSATRRDADGKVSGYVAGAAPTVFNTTGTREFCSKEDGAIRFAVANMGSQPVRDAALCSAMSPLR